ncbi:MAG: hypothetical protein GWP09_03070, partial [Nitrospiraceae bacterium]|nr:hypothetical protein [Nitrospiraceae bacterium]
KYEQKIKNYAVPVPLDYVSSKEERDSFLSCMRAETYDYCANTKYLELKNTMISECESIINIGPEYFTAGFGGTISTNEKENKSTTNKDKISENIKYSYTEISLNRDAISLGKEIRGTMTDYGIDSNNEVCFYDKPKYHEIKYSLSRTLEKGETLKIIIKPIVVKGMGVWFDIFSSGKLKKDITVKLYGNDIKNSVSFVIHPEEELKITSLTKIRNNPAWDNSWSTYEITISNPSKMSVFYKIYSNVPQSEIRVQKRTFYGSATVRTKDTELKFGWKSPKISNDYRINIIKKLQKIEANIEHKASMDIAQSNLIKRLRLNGAPKTADQVDNLFNAVDNTVAGADSLSQVNDLKNGRKNGESPIFYYTKHLVKGYSNMEGVIGNYIPDGVPLKTAMNGVSYGLIPLQEWYNTVDEMINVSNAKLINKNYSITVCVETMGDKDCKTIPVTVQGYEKVLR